jgi:hypothetical protein
VIGKSAKGLEETKGLVRIDMIRVYTISSSDRLELISGDHVKRNNSFDRAEQLIRDSSKIADSRRSTHRAATEIRQDVYMNSSPLEALAHRFIFGSL